MREAEERPTVRQSASEVALQTYHQLCCDDPLITAPVQGYKALSQVLIQQQQQQSSSSSSDPSLALSDRLVQGIQHMCQKYTRPSTTTNINNTKNTDAETDIDADENPEINDALLLSSSSLLLPAASESIDTAASALAVLAWTIYGRIPLLVGVVHGHSLVQASQLLGSYHGSPQQQQHMIREPQDEGDSPAPEEKNDHPSVPSQPDPDANSMNVEAHITALAQGPLETEEAEHNHPDTDSLEEVWAAESDPSDYDFGEENNTIAQEAQLAELDAWATSVQQLTDPVVLSQVPETLEWPHVEHAVASLLQELSFSKALSHMTLADWRRHRVSQHLTELTMALCLPRQFLSGAMTAEKQDTNSDINDNDTPSQHQWSHYALQPLHVFRDAVAVHQQALLPDYLQLIQQLLQVQEHLGGSTNTTTTVAPATWMGLSCLSTLCSNTLEQSNGPGTSNNSNNQQHYKMMVHQLQKFVLLVCDDLATILEASQDSDAAAAIPWTFLPIFETLACIPSGTTPFLNNAQAQALLNSGLFRQWIVWWERQTTISTRRVMQRSVLALCALTPTLLGKYTWRYPGYAAQVTDGKGNESTGEVEEAKSTQEQAPSATAAIDLLWNLLGIRLAEQQGTASTITWKSKKGTQPSMRPSPSVAQCQARSWDLYATMCKDVARIIEEWKSRRSNPQEEPANSSSDGQQRWEADLQCLNEFHEFCNSLSELSYILLPILCFQITPDVDGDAEKAKMAVRKMVMSTVQKSLTGWIPAITEPVSSGKKVKTEDKFDTDDDNGGEEDRDMTNEDSAARLERQRPRMEDSAVAQIRKSVKMLQSAMDSCHASSIGTTGSTSAPISFSSKAD